MVKLNQKFNKKLNENENGLVFTLPAVMNKINAFLKEY